MPSRSTRARQAARAVPEFIDVQRDESGEIDRVLADRIHEFNARATSRDDGELFAAARRDAAGDIVGHARAKGCTIVLLASHSFQSPGFYERHGYVRQAEITDHPIGHSSIFFAKRLGGT